MSLASTDPTQPKSRHARRRLLVVVGTPCGESEHGILRAIDESGDFELKVARVSASAETVALSLAERAFRGLDRRVFGTPRAQRAAQPAQAFEEGDLPAIVASFEPCAVVDLTGTLGKNHELPHSIPLLTLWFEGEAAGDLVGAVRRRLGVRRGTVHAQVRSRSSGASQTLFSAECFIDHRSLGRSQELVARKVPMILQASLARRECPEAPARPREAVPPMLGPARMMWRLAASILRRLLWRDQWGMLVYRDQPRQHLQKPWSALMPDANAFWADPFLTPLAEGVGVFFEELPFSSGKGRISYLPIDAAGKPGQPVVVLDKPWHLSYPFQFEWEGRRYMIPESSANETVDLYECVEFPQEWRFVKTLIDGRRLADATIVNWRGRLWMFAAHGQRGASNYDELHVFWANDLFGPWQEHAQNPVKIDAGSARPAGAMWVENERIVRPTQDCRDRYGDGVEFQEVVVLDEGRFEERPLGRLAPGGTKAGAAVHTFNELAGFTVIDAAGSARRW